MAPILATVPGASPPPRPQRLRQLLRLFLLFLLFAIAAQLYAQHRALRLVPDGDAPVSIVLIQVVPPGFQGRRLVQALAGPGGNPRVPAFADLEAWLNQQYARVSGRDLQAFSVQVEGPFVARPAPPPMGRPGDGLWTLIRQSWSYAAYFERLARELDVPLSPHAVRSFVLYTDQAGDRAAHSRADSKSGLAISWVALSEVNLAYAVATVAHEIGHVLGASDKYDPETGRSLHPTGFVRPAQVPLYPQVAAEFMAVDVPVGPYQEREVGRLRALRVGHASAAEMGWIPQEQAEAFYAGQ